MKGMRAYILDCGSIWNDLNLNIALATLATVADKKPSVIWADVPMYAVLIEHPTEGWILYDTGASSDAATRWPESIMGVLEVEFTEKQNLEYQLSLVGLKPSDIKTVILSHMHMDHVGNVNLFKDSADFYVSRPEATEAFLTVFASPDPAKHGFYLKEDIILPLKNLNYIDEDTELFDGIELILLPGHTPGVMGLVLHLEGGTVIVASDAIYRQENYEGHPPGIIADSAAWSKSMEKVKKLEKKYNATLWFGHDPNQYKNLKKAPEYYD